MITLGITTYNRSDMVIESFQSILDNDLINEIVIVDDCSDLSLFEDLKIKISHLDSNKIKLYRNDNNLKPLLNKLETIKKSSNDWVILLDSDNKITNEYVDVVAKLEKDNNSLYIPELLLNFNNDIISDFSSMKNHVLNKDNIKNSLDNNSITTILNTGNFFVNKLQYIKTFENVSLEKNLETNDSIYFSFLWLSNNLNIQIVDNLKYFHRQHDGSWYLNHKNECENNTVEIINRLRNF